MKVSDILNRNGVRFNENSTLCEIVRTIVQTDQKSFAVLDPQGRVSGIINAKAMLRMVLPSYFSILQNFEFIDDFGPLEKMFEKQLSEFSSVGQILAKDFMITKVFRVKESISLMKASALMLKYNIEFLPVVDADNRYIGYVTEKNILKVMLGKMMPGCPDNVGKERK